MNWLKNLSELILKISEEWGDVPGTAMPTISLLLDLAKWGQKKGVKPKIIKELCQKHHKEHTKIKNMEDLRAAGIPEAEIEAAYSLAIAKLDNPSLVRYLESSNKHQKNLVAELLNNFEQLHRALKNQYQVLQPAETVLQNPPIIKEFSEPRFFRKTGPVYADIEAGKVYVRKAVKTVTDALVCKGAVLLVGQAATGKSVITRTIAHEAMKKGWKVFFVELKTASVDFGRMNDEIARLCNDGSDALLLIEDAHLKSKRINGLLANRHTGWPKMLITTRTAEPELHTESVNWYKLLYQITLKPFSPAEKIIEMYFNAKEKNGWELNDKIKADILDYSKENLWVLSYALSSLSETAGRSIHEESVLTQVEKDLESLKRMPSPPHAVQMYLFIPVLVSLANLYRFEIPTDSRFLVNWIKDTTEREIEIVLDKLAEMGEVHLSKQNGLPLYSLPHSALADLYYNYGKKSKYYKLVDDEKFACEYVTSNDCVNNLELFGLIEYKNDYTIPIDIISSDLISHINIVRLAEIVSQSTNFRGVVDCIDTIFKANKSAGEQLWENMDIARLAKTISKSRDPWAIGFCIPRLCSAIKSDDKQLWDHMNIARFAETISQSKDLSGIGNCILGIFLANKSAGEQLWGHLNIARFAETISQSKNLAGIGICIARIYDANKSAGEQLWESIDIDWLAKNLSQSTDLAGIVDCIGNIYESFSLASEQLCAKIDISRLAKTISQGSNPDNMIYVIEKFANIYEWFCAELIAELKRFGINY